MTYPLPPWIQRNTDGMNGLIGFALSGGAGGGVPSSVRGSPSGRGTSSSPPNSYAKWYANARASNPGGSTSSLAERGGSGGGMYVYGGTPVSPRNQFGIGNPMTMFSYPSPAGFGTNTSQFLSGLLPGGSPGYGTPGYLGRVLQNGLAQYFGVPGATPIGSWAGRGNTQMGQHWDAHGNYSPTTLSGQSWSPNQLMTFNTPSGGSLGGSDPFGPGNVTQIGSIAPQGWNASQLSGPLSGSGSSSGGGFLAWLKELFNVNSD